MGSACASPRCRQRGVTAPPARAASASGNGCPDTCTGTGSASPPGSRRRACDRTVVFLVVLPVLPRPQGTPPLRMVHVPPHRALQPLGEGDPRFPTQVGYSRHAAGIPVVVAWTIGAVLDQPLWLPHLLPPPL